MCARMSEGWGLSTDLTSPETKSPFMRLQSTPHLHGLLNNHPNQNPHKPLTAIDRGPWLGGARGIAIGLKGSGAAVGRSGVGESGSFARRTGELGEIGERIGSGWEGRGVGGPRAYFGKVHFHVRLLCAGRENNPVSIVFTRSTTYRQASVA